MKKGFTLIELLVVIAIVSVLSVVVILTLNPAELLKQARDSNRLSDAATIKSAIALYLSDAASPSIGDTGKCYVSNVSVASANCGVFSGGTLTTSASRAVDGTGWIPVNFNSISSGAPLGQLPVDPINDATYYYAYRSSSTLYEFNIVGMESAKFKNGGSADVVSTDGGNKANSYEVGTYAGLDL